MQKRQIAIALTMVIDYHAWTFASIEWGRESADLRGNDPCPEEVVFRSELAPDFGGSERSSAAALWHIGKSSYIVLSFLNAFTRGNTVRVGEV